MMTGCLVLLHDRGATLLQVPVRQPPRQHGTPSAYRPSVMVRTFRELLSLWWSWRRNRSQAS